MYRRKPQLHLPQCADGTGAHRFVIRDVKAPVGPPVRVRRTCQRCPYTDMVMKVWDGAHHTDFTTQRDRLPVFGYTRKGYFIETA